MVGNVINSMVRRKCDCENCVKARKDLQILRDAYFKNPKNLENWYKKEKENDN